MLRNYFRVGCLALAALGAGCSNAPVTPSTPADTRAADVQAIKDLETAWLKDLSTKDADKFAGYYADDASGLYPGAATLNGKAAIKAGIAPYLADPNFAYTFQSTRVVASRGGDMVYSEGTYSWTMTNPKTKKPVTDKGKYLTVYMKQSDGSWKAVADTFNSDSPM